MTKKEDHNPCQSPGAGGPENREALALERIADTLDNIAALLASQRVQAGSSVSAKDDGDDAWIECQGRQPTSERVDILFRDSDILKNEDPSGWFWGLTGSVSDIVAYRIHKTQEGKTE